MGFVNENANDDPSLGERYGILKWTVDRERRAYLNCVGGTSRFGCTAFYFYWNIEIKEVEKSLRKVGQNSIEAGNKLRCQAKREINEIEHSIHHTVYLPELSQYPEEIIEWLTEAIKVYGINGMDKEVWQVSTIFVDGAMPDNNDIPEFKTFRNETATEYLKKKYNIIEGIGDEDISDITRWAIDHERDALLFLDRIRMRYVSYLFFWKGKRAASFTAEITIHRDERDYFHQVFNVSYIYIVPEFEEYRNLITDMIEEAIHVHGELGCYVPDYYIDFKLKNDPRR